MRGGAKVGGQVQQKPTFSAGFEPAITRTEIRRFRAALSVLPNPNFSISFICLLRV
jgi:hypothetical protein